MGAYHQIGHDSENLLELEELSCFRGALASPTNYDLGRTIAQRSMVNTSNWEYIFDPQLYFPSSTRSQLPTWTYYPKDFDLVDRTNIAWWKDLSSRIVEVVGKIGPTAVCTPAIVPRAYSDYYYSLITEVGNHFQGELKTSGVDTLLTVIAKFEDLQASGNAYRIASIVSQTVSRRIYLVFVTETPPRRELDSQRALVGACNLITSLERAGIEVLVGYSSSDCILWKYAGATSCAAGKFFNLRRFTQSRWDEPIGGGRGQLSYWFEDNLMAFLRESDVVRVVNAKMLSNASLRNPFREEIVRSIQDGSAWVGLGWRFFLWWFCDFEGRVQRQELDAKKHLKECESRWLQLEDENILFEEPRNDGSWIRPWRQTLIDSDASK